MNRTSVAGLVRPERRRVVLAVGLAVLQGLMLYPSLWLVRELFDRIIPDGHTGRSVLACAGILVVRIAAVRIGLAQRTVAMKAAKGAAATRRRELMGWLLNTDVARLVDVDPGRLQGRLVQETERLDVMLNRALSSALPSAVSAVLAVGAMMVLNWKLAVVTLALGAPASWLAARGGQNASSATRVFQESFEHYSSGVRFVVRHLMLVRSRGHVALEREKQDAAIEELRARGVTMAVTYARQSSRQATTVTAVAVVVLAVGSILVINGGLTVGELAAFYVSALACGNAVGQLGSAIPEVLGGLVAAERLTELTDGADLTVSSAPSGGGGVPIDLLPIRFERVSFSYGTRSVLSSVDLDLSRGRHVDLSGANGAGKSTVVRLVLGLEHLGDGTITAAGVPLAELDAELVRRQIGYAPQQPTFFTGSVLENVLYGRPGATRVDAERAADLAGITERVLELDGGFDAPLGEDGIRLSGGEGQRLAIARALVGDPQLVILDEPGNHLPRDSVAAIVERIRRERPQVALLTIGHGHLAADVAEVSARLEAGRLTTEVRDG